MKDFFANFLNKWILYVTVLFAAVILLWVLLSAIGAGRAQAQSNVVLENVRSISLALNYFYEDQGRFPKLQEFQNKNIMLNYLSSLPENKFVSKTCSQNFAYERLSQNAYEFSFCIPAATAGYDPGWNKLKVSK